MEYRRLSQYTIFCAFVLFEKNMYSEDVYFDDPDTGYKPK